MEAVPTISGSFPRTLNRDNASLAAIIVLQLTLIFAHSPWRDEEHALLLAQQPWPSLIHLLHYEGHPLLWYVVLKVAATFSHSVWVLPLVQSIVATAVQVLLWRASPFTWSTRCLISLGYFVLFEFGVIARSYDLGVLLFFLFVLTRRSFVSWIFLALLANVALHTVVLACFCAAWQLLEKRWSWRGSIILAVACVFSLWSMWPMPDVVTPLTHPGELDVRFVRALAKNAVSISPAMPNAERMWEPPMAPWLGVSLGIVTLVLGAFGLRSRRWHLALFLGFSFSLIAMGALIYPIHARHIGFAAILFIGLMWDQVDDGLGVRGPSFIWLAAMALGGAVFSVATFAEPFSASRDLAAWARANGAVTQPWAAMPGHIGEDFSAQFGRQTFNLQQRCWNSYMLWDYPSWDTLPDNDLSERVAAFADATGGGYVMVEGALPPSAPAMLLAKLPRNQIGSDVSIYRVLPRANAVRRSLPVCRKG